MKQLVMTTFLVALMLPCLFAQQAQQQPVKQSPKEEYLKKMIRLVSDVDNLGNNLSVFVTIKLPKIKSFEGKHLTIIENFLDTIQKRIDTMLKVPLKQQLDAKDITDFVSQLNHFEVQDTLMRETLGAFHEELGQVLYTAQIDYAEERIERFLTATANFKQYLIGLGQTAITPVDLVKIITDLHKKTDSFIVVNNTIIKKIDSSQNSRFYRIDSLNNVLNKKADTIKKLLQRDTIKYAAYGILSAYAGNVFGLSYFHRVGDPKPAIPCYYWGAEFVAAVKSSAAQNVGAFALFGLRDEKFLLQAGIGYLKGTKIREDISWKAGLVYGPKNWGLGMGYSPLTGAGLQIAYRW